MHNPLICPACGRTGQQSGQWVRPGVAAGDLVAGLDPQNCSGCWDTMTHAGIAPGIFTTDDNGNQKFEPIRRPVTA
jgi:hypothetical protein